MPVCKYLAIAKMPKPGSLRQRIRRSVRSEAPLAQVKQPPPFEMVRAARRAALGRGERNHDAVDAPLAGEALHFDPPAAGSDALLTDRQAESEPAAVASATIERSEEFFGLSRGKPTALVFDLDADLSGFDGRSQRHVTPRARELEGVAQQVPDCRREQLPVAVHRDAVLRRDHGEADASRFCFHRRARLEVFDELGERYARTGMEAGREPDFRQR